MYIVAPSGAGKSFLGDALAYLHGYTHVDGDSPWKHAAVSARNTALLSGWVRSLKMVVDDNADGPNARWTPYDELATRTLQAAKQRARWSSPTRRTVRPTANVS